MQKLRQLPDGLELRPIRAVFAHADIEPAFGAEEDSSIIEAVEAEIGDQPVRGPDPRCRPDAERGVFDQPGQVHLDFSYFFHGNWQLAIGNW